MKTIAFIPVRGGSKSIPLKNIKLFCGKPLVCWNIEALEACNLVDEVIVATDSDDIWNTVESRHYTKTKLYRRSAENACDTASTESVMLEYIQYAQLPKENIFMLVQATSPLTEDIHFTEALQMYSKGGYDSILTCVRNYRFFWNENGSSMNYDYMNRPRRQNFQGTLMENGAFYINTVGNILKSGNRLCGKIGIYEMPEYTATEIDEPDDWIILESLMKRHVLSKDMGTPDQKRLEMARALATKPRIMLLDEPFGAVDAITRLNLQNELLRIHRETGGTFLFVTHDIHEAFRLGNRVMIMNAGRLLQMDTPETIVRNPADPFVETLIRSALEQERFWSSTPAE